jgi:hypothetical protein
MALNSGPSVRRSSASQCSSFFLGIRAGQELATHSQPVSVFTFILHPKVILFGAANEVSPLEQDMDNDKWFKVHSCLYFNVS